MKAILCPVCSGTGKVIWDKSDKIPMGTEYSCHGCDGKGWVEVGEDKTDYALYPTYTWHPSYHWNYDP